MNYTEYKEYVRFRLSKLRSANAHHEFEHLCYELARKRIAPNLLEATGPVGAGGDQGRDFESYKTYLAGALGYGAFVGRASDDTIVGACTLQQNIVEKVTADLETIFSRQPRPNRIVYFCEVDVPVGRRHELEDKCRQTYGADLTIFDGVNITDALLDDDTRWIAEQYLGVAESLDPEKPKSARYQHLRLKWLTEKNTPENFADFLEVRSGLRSAAASDEAKGDLSEWLAIMRPFTTSALQRLAQRARYEICMAELRGNFSLNPALELWHAFFTELAEDSATAELADAAALLLHGFEAMRRHQGNLELSEIRAALSKVDAILDAQLGEDPDPSDRIALLEAKSLLAPLISGSSESSLDAIVELWREIISIAKETPFSPVLHIGGMMMELNRHFGFDARVRAMNAEVDELIAARTGKYESANRAKSRALDHLKAGRRLAAIDEFHRARLGYFANESIIGSILAMFILTNTYAELHLHFAARYYASAALFIALKHPGDDAKHLIGRAALKLSTALFLSGEGLTFLHSLAMAMDLHNRTAEDSEDWEKHEEVMQALLHATIFRAVTRTLAPHLLDKVDAAIDLLPVPQNEVVALRRMSEAAPWGTMSPSDLRERIGQEVGPTLFADIGGQRELTWTALGVTWTIRHGAEPEDRLRALELAATLQIVQAELAQMDLAIIPSDITIHLRRDDTSMPTITLMPGNSDGDWEVAVPSDMSSMCANDVAAHAMAVAMACLRSASALPDGEFQALIVQQMKGGLANRALVARPVAELLTLAIPETLDFAELRRLEPIPLLHGTRLQDPELAWRTGPGPHYSRERAIAALENRYKHLLGSVRVTLPKLVAENRCRQIIETMRSEGMLDWQILSVLANIVAWWQLRQVYGEPQSKAEWAVAKKRLQERLYRDEDASDPAFDLNYLTHELVALQRVNQTMLSLAFWRLESHRRTPNFNALKQLLDVRYMDSTDDVPHDDPFWIRS